LHRRRQRKLIALIEEVQDRITAVEVLESLLRYYARTSLMATTFKTMYRDSILRKVRSGRLLHDVTLELTYQCNLDCFFCYNDRAKTGRPLSLEQYRTLLEDLARMQTLFLMLTGGEPMIHPHFFEIGRMTKELGFVVRVRTNGHTAVPAQRRAAAGGGRSLHGRGQPARGERRGARSPDPRARQLRTAGPQPAATPARRGCAAAW
jgi:hypothetical protein